MPDSLAEIAEESARGGLFLLTGNILYAVISAVGVIAVARLLGPGEYGLYSLSLVIPGLLLPLIDLGVNPALTRFSAKLRAEGRGGLAASMLKSGLLFKLVASLSMFALCFTFSDLLVSYILNRPGLGFFVRLASLLIVFQAIFAMANSTFIGLDRMENSALTMVLQAITKATISILLVALGFGIAGAVIGHVSGYMAAGALASLLLIKHYRTLSANPSNNGESLLSNLRTMVSYGLPLYFSTLLFSFQGQYQNIVLALFVSDVEIGNLNAAMKFTSLILLLTSPIATTLFPAFSKLNPEGDVIKRLFKLSVKYTSLIIVPASVLVAILSKPLVHTVYGLTYEQAPMFLSLYVVTFLYAGIGSLVIGSFLNGVGDTRTTLKIRLITLTSFAPLSIFATRLYRVPGLIVALLISNLLGVGYGLLIVGKRFNANLDIEASLKTYLASFLSATPTLAFLHLSPLQPLPNVMVGSLLYLTTYLTLTPLTGTITHTDLENLRLILSRFKIVWPVVRPVLTYEAKLLSATKRMAVQMSESPNNALG